MTAAIHQAPAPRPPSWLDRFLYGAAGVAPGSPGDTTVAGAPVQRRMVAHHTFNGKTAGVYFTREVAPGTPPPAGEVLERQRAERALAIRAALEALARRRGGQPVDAARVAPPQDPQMGPARSILDLIGR